MSDYAYTIVMDTQLGQRHGTMLLHIDGNEVGGKLCILEKEQTVHGELFESGKCKLYGQIITLTRTIEYIAEGTLNDAEIDLELHGERNVFHLSGIAIATGGEVNAEVL